MQLRKFIPAAALMCVLALTGCNGAQPRPHTENNPLFGTQLYVGQAIHAIAAEHDLRTAGHVSEADQIDKLAAQPTATWLSGGLDAQYDHVLAANILAAATPAETPIFVLYNLPNRDAGAEFSKGGAADARSYKDWAASIIAELGNRKAIVVVEPDSIASIARGDLRGDQATGERYELIRYVLSALRDHPGVHTYLDAGNPGWTNPSEMAGLLRRAGVDLADGIAVNVSNFYSDDESGNYGRELSYLLGGVGVIVDRGRNGNGAEWPQNKLSYCNPSGRAIGKPPVIGGQTDVINAWLWIKPPGESDGNCRLGEPSAGQFWLEYALGLVKGK